MNRGQRVDGVNFFKWRPTDLRAQRERLKDYIMTCFENFETDLAKVDISHLSSPVSHVSYQEFYDLVYRITRFDTNPFCAYDIYRSCATGWFNQFAKLLSRKLAPINCQLNCKPNEPVDLKPAKLLVCFWRNIFNNVLNYIGSAFMYLERINWKSSDQILIIEMTNTMFAELIIEKQQEISAYILGIIKNGLELNHSKIETFLLANLNRCGINNVISIDEILTPRDEEQLKVVNELIQMLIKLDNDNLVLFYTVVELSLISQNSQFGKKFSSKHIGNLSILEYVRFMYTFIKLNYELIGKLGFPLESKVNYNNLLCFQLLTQRMQEIIYQPTSGFQMLLSHENYEAVGEIYQSLDTFYQTTGQENLLKKMVSFVETYLADQLRQMTTKFRLKNRVQTMMFVDALITIHQRWDHIQQNVFAKHGKFETLIKQFYFDLIKINDRTPQSIAFFMHDLLMDNSEILCYKYQTSQVNINRTDLRKQMLNSVCLLIPYIKDINSFFDYSKHYFCLRQFRKTVLHDLQTDYIDQICQIIKRNFCSENNVQKNFSQSLQDFRLILADYGQSCEFHTTTYRPMFNSFIENFHILHAGIWKMIDYDNCVLPEAINQSFRSFELYYQVKYQRRKLLLNTKYSKVTIGIAPTQRQKKPIELTTSMHQFAILSLFNEHNQLSYETMFDLIKFQKEFNLQLALISLLYVNLLKCDPGAGVDGANIKDCIFQINDSYFDKLLSNSSATIVHDISEMEDVDFWNSDLRPLLTVVNAKSNVTLRALINEISDDKDLHFNCSTNVVEDLSHDNILLQSNTDVESEKKKKNLKENAKSSALLASSESRRMMSKIRFKDHMNPSDSSLYELSKESSVSNLVSSSRTQPIATNAIERTIKIEAAIVRVLKKAQTLPTMNSIYIRVREEIKKRGVPFPEDVTFEEIQKVLLILIDKKYVKRSGNGGFEFLVD